MGSIFSLPLAAPRDKVADACYLCALLKNKELTRHNNNFLIATCALAYMPVYVIEAVDDRLYQVWKLKRDGMGWSANSAQRLIPSDYVPKYLDLDRKPSIWD